MNPDAVVVEGPGYTGPVRRGDVIRAVVFDAGNTLVRMNYVAISRELATLGVRATPAEVQRAEWQARVRLDTEVFARAPGASTESRSSGAHYVRLILGALGVSDASVVEAVVEWRRSYNAPRGLFDVADPVAEPALRLVRDRGLTAGVVSNSNGTLQGLFDRLDPTRFFDHLFDSHLEKIEKPDPRFFTLALERSGARAERTVHVGDLYHVDVAGARSAGLEAVLLDAGGLYPEADCPRVPSLRALADALQPAPD